MKRMHYARATRSPDSASARAIEQLNAHLDKQPRLSSAALVAEKIKYAPYQEMIVAGRYQVLANVEDTIALLRAEGERVAVIRCVEDCPGLRAMEARYGVELSREQWVTPEQEEQAREFLMRVLAEHKLDILIVQNATQFARLCHYHSFQVAELLWADLFATAATAMCQVTLIRRED